MTHKDDSIKSLRKQGYKLKYILPTNNPKACVRRWNDGNSDSVIPDNCNYAVIQDENRLVLDIDDDFFNHILDEYLDRTLVIQTGGGGCHGYFKDKTRVKQIKSSPLYHNGSHIGDIKAATSYVIGAYSIHENGKKYKQISTTGKVLEIDFEEILKTLKKHGISTKKENKIIHKREFLDGLLVGERNDECFKTACDVFEKRKLNFESGLNFIKTWNGLSEHSLDDSEIEIVVKSAWRTIHNKEIQFDSDDKIDNVASVLQKNYRFLTIRKTEEILLYNGKIYDNLQAETIIKEETEKLIPNCTTHHRNEVVNKIKAQTFTDIENFDSDPNLITISNGILNLETLELFPHTPEHLSRVLLPVKYAKPIHDIADDSIFADVEKNLKDTLFWKFLKSSFTINGEFRRNDFETTLEIISSPIIKRHIDEKAFMFLGQGENGKSVCLGYIAAYIGKNNVSSITLQDIADEKFMRANLDGMSANIFSDLEQNELRHTGKIKAITSNEGIEVQKKHQQGFTLYPFCKLLFSCNRFPKVFDQTQGFFRRWMIIKWDRNFENDPERIPYLREKLAENFDEMNTVFSCLVVIANKLNRAGQFTHSKNWKTIQREWNENADPIDDFDSNYIIDSEHNKNKRDTYQFYKETMLSKGETPSGMGQFSKAFEEYHDQDILKSDGKTQRVWLNIDFKIPKQTTLSEIDCA